MHNGLHHEKKIVQNKSKRKECDICGKQFNKEEIVEPFLLGVENRQKPVLITQFLTFFSTYYFQLFFIFLNSTLNALFNVFFCCRALIL